MDITEKEMNRNAVKNAVKTDITDEERLADLLVTALRTVKGLKKCVMCFGRLTTAATATAWRGNFQRAARVLRRVIGK